MTTRTNKSGTSFRIVSLVSGVLFAAMMTGPAAATVIDVIPQAAVAGVPNGTNFNVLLKFASVGEPPLDWRVADVFISWDSTLLDFVGWQDNAAVVPPSAVSNATEQEPGVLLYSITAMAGPSLPADPAPGGTLVTTLEFKADAPDPLPVTAQITVIAAYKSSETIVQDEFYTVVTGALGSTGVIIDVPEPGTLSIVLMGLVFCTGAFRRRRA